MILSLNNKESAALTLHMAIMRKSFRNLIKKKYSSDKKEYLASYDYVHDESRKGLEASEMGFDYYTLNLNIKDLTILTEFLRSYLNQVNEEFKDKLQESDKEQIHVLTKLWEKCNKMIEEVEEITA